MTKEALGVWPGRKTKDRTKCVRVGRGQLLNGKGQTKGQGRGRGSPCWAPAH